MKRASSCNCWPLNGLFLTKICPCDKSKSSKKASLFSQLSLKLFFFSKNKASIFYEVFTTNKFEIIREFVCFMRILKMCCRGKIGSKLQSAKIKHTYVPRSRWNERWTFFPHNLFFAHPASGSDSFFWSPRTSIFHDDLFLNTEEYLCDPASSTKFEKSLIEEFFLCCYNFERWFTLTEWGSTAYVSSCEAIVRNCVSACSGVKFFNWFLWISIAFSSIVGVCFSKILCSEM